MKTKEKFMYDVDPGAIMDFVEDHFMLVIKDDVWTEEEIQLLQRNCQLYFCYTQDIAIFVIEGGDIDSSDFYFNIQECDWKDVLLQQQLLDIEFILVDQNNDICFKKQKTLSQEQSAVILECLRKQSQVQFMPGEYDVNVEGIQNAYEPYELNIFSKLEMTF